jgi:hypothetical protein
LKLKQIWGYTHGDNWIDNAAETASSQLASRDYARWIDLSYDDITDADLDPEFRSRMISVMDTVAGPGDRLGKSDKPSDIHAATIKSHAESAQQELGWLVKRQLEGRHIAEALRAVDVRPRVYMIDADTAIVITAMFTKWGGFSYRCLRVTLPNIVKPAGPETTIYKYDCGITY